MGFITSSTTVSAVAYLTELGRKYLFNSLDNPRYVLDSQGQIIDRLEIKSFSLGDPDVNYNVPVLESGDVPDVSGENGSCITGAKGKNLTNLISPKSANLSSDDISLVYQHLPNTDININLGTKLSDIINLTIPITTTLKTKIDGFEPDGTNYQLDNYVFSPTNYGFTQATIQDDLYCLIINLKEPTTTEPGYRMKIIFPQGNTYRNKFIVQFEKGTINTSSISGNNTSTSGSGDLTISGNNDSITIPGNNDSITIPGNNDSIAGAGNTFAGNFGI